MGPLRKALIAGATGAIGRELLTRLQQAPFEQPPDEKTKDKGHPRKTFEFSPKNTLL
jgi:aspartate-semialdehyde dehydrogenase